MTFVSSDLLSNSIKSATTDESKLWAGTPSGSGLGIIPARLLRRVRGFIHGLDDGDAAVLRDLGDAGGQAAVGHEGLHLADMADAHRRGAPELGAVGHQDHVARIGDDGLRRLDLAVVEIEQGAVLVDRRRADHGVVDLELLDEVVRLLADHRTVGAAYRAAGHDDLDPRT